VFSFIDPTVALAGLFVGFVVGLTGMGGGALMTPILVLLFKVSPLAAVSSDIVASLIMKPVGGGVHWRRGTVNTELVKWLVLGSVPSAFLGVLLLKSSGQGEALQHNVCYFTTIRGARAAIMGIEAIQKKGLTIRSLQEHHSA